MKLYYSPGACSLSPHIALQEAGLAFTPVLVSTKSHKLQDGSDFYEINPLGYVPVLELDDGSRLREGPAIVQYIADQAPHKNLAPANGTLGRYRLQEWLNFISTELHKGFSPWLWHKETADSTRQAVKAKLAVRFAEMDAVLSRSDFLAGRYSVADAYGFTIVNWSNLLGIPLTAYPHLQAWMARVAARPQVQAALRAEGLLA